MSPVGAEVMLREYERLRELGEEESEELVAQFYQQQPALSDYLAECINELHLEEERDLGITLAVAAWLAMRSVAGPRLRKVSPDLIRSVQIKNFQLLRELEESGQSEWLKSAGQFESDLAGKRLFESNQEDLERFSLATILLANEESCGRTHQQAAFEFTFLKTIIECLDRDPGLD